MGTVAARKTFSLCAGSIIFLVSRANFMDWTSQICELGYRHAPFILMPGGRVFVDKNLGPYCPLLRLIKGYGRVFTYKFSKTEFN